MEEHKRTRQHNPARGASALSNIVFWWLNPIFKIGRQRTIQESDLYEVLREDSAEHLHKKLEKEWSKELQKSRAGQQPSLILALTRTFGAQYFVYGLFCLADELARLAMAVLMGYLIGYFRPGSDMTSRDAYLMASLFSVLAVLPLVTHHRYFYKVTRLGMWLRVAICALMYSKFLKLSNGSIGKITSGKVVNLMANDSFGFEHAAEYYNHYWIAPIQTAAVIALLWPTLGPSSLCVLLLLIGLTPLNSFLGFTVGKLRSKAARFTDKRIRLMNEIVVGIRVIKMYCWEKMFYKTVGISRRQEMWIVCWTKVAKNCQHIILNCGKHALSYAIVLAVLLTSETRPVLQADVVYPAIALMAVLSQPYFVGIGNGMMMAGELHAAINRMQDFLLLEEIETRPLTCKADSQDESRQQKAYCVQLSGVSAMWDKSSDFMVLQGIDFSVRSGLLTGVIGPVGAGKTSFLMAILQELPLISGDMILSEKPVYAAQQPWIFSASVRQNIIFGSPFDEGKYRRVIKAAVLNKDLSALPNGDATLVGERGVVLSGGQKARVSLARTLYADASFYLLDDPLSAVDNKVGQHIFERCICDMLRNKTRILVTHRLQYLREMDEIVILQSGKVFRRGTYDELASAGVDLEALLGVSDDEGSAVSRQDYQNYAEVTKGTQNTTPTGKLGDSRPEAEHLLSSNNLTNDIIKEPQSLDRSIPSIESSGLTNSLQSLSTAMSDSEIVFSPELQEEEHRRDGSVKRSVFIKFFLTGAGPIGAITFVIAQVLAQSTSSMFDWWLAYWIGCEDACATNHLSEIGRSNTTFNTTYICETDGGYLRIYSVLLGGVFVTECLRMFTVAAIFQRASIRMHDTTLQALIRTPVRFFDINSSGRILNRFSRDLSVIDNNLPLYFRIFMEQFLMILGSVILGIIINPWLSIPSIILTVLGCIVRWDYMRNARHLKRLEATTRSPVYSHVCATIEGLHTIRAFESQKIFVKEFYLQQDLHTSAWFTYNAANRWFAVCLDCFVAVFITVTAFGCVAFADSLDSNLVGLALSTSLRLLGDFQWGIRLSVEVENMMTSVERMQEYMQLTPEAAMTTMPDIKLEPDWPTRGEIRLTNACLQYTRTGRVVLRKVNLFIKSKQKVGIVGRTGAGKSSLINLLLRMTEPQGYIRIDDVDILQLGLHDLRGNISVIPQDPLLFMGTIRHNLDPFDQHSEEQIWRCLKEVQLDDHSASLPGQLHSAVSEGGWNFSVGQRQLMCLARALLRQNKILMIDEATANVDKWTDSLLQKTIRDRFKDCTVLTIAHRLNTVMDSDRILVISNGECVEFDHPHVLLRNSNGALSSLVHLMGPNEEMRLREIAEEMYNSNQC